MFLPPKGELLIHLAVAILDDLLSHRFTDSPVAMACGQLANSLVYLGQRISWSS